MPQHIVGGGVLLVALLGLLHLLRHLLRRHLLHGLLLSHLLTAHHFSLLALHFLLLGVHPAAIHLPSAVFALALALERIKRGLLGRSLLRFLSGIIHALIFSTVCGRLRGLLAASCNDATAGLIDPVVHFVENTQSKYPLSSLWM
jgi:hypothetical protein